MIHIEIRKIISSTGYRENKLKNFKLIKYKLDEIHKTDCYLSIFTGSNAINRKEFTIRIPNFNLNANYGLTIDFTFKKVTTYCSSKHTNRFINFFKLPVEVNY